MKPEREAVKRPSRKIRGRLVYLIAGLEVRRSEIQGLGVFAARDFAQDELIGEYEGRRYRIAEVTARMAPTAGGGHNYWADCGDGEHWLNARESGNQLQFINHACDDNTYPVWRAGRLYLHAKRDVRAGEELTWGYVYHTEEGELPCLCRKPRSAKRGGPKSSS